jgi:cytosol alanyl aminopeptidase
MPVVGPHIHSSGAIRFVHRPLTRPFSPAYHSPMKFLYLLAVASLPLAAAEPPKLKLGDDVRPVKYAAELTLFPGAATIAGDIGIDISLAKPASLIWLNASKLTIEQATISRPGQTTTAAVEQGDSDFIALRVPSEIPAGAATIHIRYQGAINFKDPIGVFQGKDGEETYLYTQFETTGARRAFPCFDQPDFKTPWQLTLHVRSTDRAFSNSPQMSETPEANGMKRVVFGETKPLPSYLVAAAVGPFEVVDSGVAGRNKIPVRIVVPKGKMSWARYAAQVTAIIVQRLEDYFDVPFPYEKVDNVAIALSAGFAMENAGMVTYAQDIILADPATDSIDRQREYAGVAAHELAHQWFGDLVTTAWWDDTWLNEAFATWTSSRILATWKPEWKTRLGDLGAKFGAMSNDSLISARSIRQPIESRDDIANAFDGITYQKGAAVIRMFENWMGESDFQRGVKTYLTRYAYKSAHANDFLDAVGGAGKPGFGKAFDTFLEQPGIPEISTELICAGTPRVRLSQKQYLPIGSAGNGEQTWKTPVCVRYPNASGPQSECFLLDSSSAEFPLTKTNSCPAYLYPNADAEGYYLATYSGDLLEKVTGHAESLNNAEKVSLLHDLAAGADAGRMKLSAGLATAQNFASSPERQIVGQVQAIASRGYGVVPLDLMPNYQRYIRKLFAARAEVLGWSAKPGDSDDTRLLRASLVPFVASRGANEPLQAEARRLARAWLKDRKGVDNDMLAGVLSTAARSGGQEIFDGLVGVLKTSKDARERETVLTALGAFHDRKLLNQSLALLTDPSVNPLEAAGLLFGPVGERETRTAPFEFVKSHIAEVEKALPFSAVFDLRAYLPFTGQGFCNEAGRNEFVDFFQERAKTYNGGPRYYAQALESIRLCEAKVAAQSADVTEFFKAQ